MKKCKIAEEQHIKKQTQNIILPRFCWVCGNLLNEFGLGFYKCSKCGADFLPSINNKSNIQRLDMINPPHE